VKIWVPLIAAVVAPVVTVALAAFFGDRIRHGWEVRRLRSQLDLAARDEFYRLYADFFAVMRLWKADYSALPEHNSHWTLLDRASTAEGAVDALLVKLATERDLRDHHVQVLAAFRQVYQRLRESLRDRTDFGWHSSADPEYRAFKALAVNVAGILNETTTSDAAVPQPPPLRHRVPRLRSRKFVRTREPVLTARERYKPGAVNILAATSNVLEQSWLSVAEPYTPATEEVADRLEVLGIPPAKGSPRH
jgi:hypothetical protein